VYFPKRVAYQGRIFSALKDGLTENKVRAYISQHICEIMEEMRSYPQLFDPDQYERKAVSNRLKISSKQALQRIEMYRSPFHGWSMHEVDGVFSGNDGRTYDERTQIIRLIFRATSKYHQISIDAGCYDVFEALKRWVMAEHNRLDHILPWSAVEQSRFLNLHGIWPKHKQAFVVQYYESITKETKQWIDDIGLFIFGYLVRHFWKEVIACNAEEDEIWVTSFFNLNLNIVRRQGEL
jgi:hypothetical protein